MEDVTLAVITCKALPVIVHTSTPCAIVWILQAQS